MKLLLTLLGIVLDLVWTIVATVVLGCVFIAIADFVFNMLPQQLLRRFKKLRAWCPDFWARHAIWRRARNSACQSI
jgi:hypothetical protein